MPDFSFFYFNKCICAENFLEFIKCAGGWTVLGLCGWRCHSEKERRVISISPSVLTPPPPPPILPFPVFPLWQHVKDLYRGKRLEKGNEVKFIFCRNIFLSGSMPPNSHSIFEEGAVFKSFKIVSEGVFQEQGKVVTVNWFFFLNHHFSTDKKLLMLFYVCTIRLVQAISSAYLIC